MKTMRLYILSLFVLAFFTAHLPGETPEDVVTRYFAKLKDGGLNTVASLMHPEELQKFQEMLTPIIESALASNESKIFQMFADSKEPSRIRKLSGAEFMNLFMEWIESVKPGVNTIMKDAKVEALGHVREGDIRHVVVKMRMKSEGIEIEKISVVSVKDFHGVPKMILTGEMKGMAEALKRRR